MEILYIYMYNIIIWNYTHRRELLWTTQQKNNLSLQKDYGD